METISEMIVNNPQASFLENVTSSIKKGGNITIRGTMSNKFFNKIFNGKAKGLDKYTVESKTLDVPNQGFTRTDGLPIKGTINEIVLTKK